MSTSPLSLFRCSSPDFYLPTSHTELMSLYKSWNSFSPKFKSKTYKKDAASLIVSWIKTMLKKKLWCWRRNACSSKVPKVNFSLQVKKPSAFIQRRVYLELQFNRNIINRKISQKSKNYATTNSVCKTTRTSYVSNSIKKGKHSKETVQKCKSAEKIGKLLFFLVKKQYMDVYFEMLLVARAYWVGKKLNRMLLKKVKSKLEGFFKELKNLNIKNSFEIFKIFAKQAERNVVKQESLNLSARGFSRLSKESQTNNTNSTSFLEISAQNTPSRSKLHIELSPISRVVHRSNPYSHKNLTKLAILVQSLLKKTCDNALKDLKSLQAQHKKLEKFCEITLSLKENLKKKTFISIKLKYSAQKFLRILSSLTNNKFVEIVKRFKKFSELNQKFHKVSKISANCFRFLKQRVFYRLKSGSASKKNVKKNLGVVAYALKIFINNYLKVVFCEVHEHAEKVKFLMQKEKKQKIESIFKVIFNKVQDKRLFLLRKLQKYNKNFKFFSESLQVAYTHRSNHLKKISLNYWKKLKISNKRFCRGFELLGTFMNSKKVSFFTLINLPNPQKYYTSHRYQTLLKTLKILFTHKNSKVSKLFKHWKLEIMYIKLLKFSIVIHRKFILALISSFKLLNSGT